MTFLQDLMNTQGLILVLLILAAILLVVSIVKQLFKLALLVALAMVLYMGYLVFTEQKVPQSSEELLQHTVEQIEKLKDSGTTIIEKEIEKEKGLPIPQNDSN